MDQDLYIDFGLASLKLKDDDATTRGDALQDLYTMLKRTHKNTTSQDKQEIFKYAENYIKATWDAPDDRTIEMLDIIRQTFHLRTNHYYVAELDQDGLDQLDRALYGIATHEKATPMVSVAAHQQLYNIFFFDTKNEMLQSQSTVSRSEMIDYKFWPLKIIESPLVPLDTLVRDEIKAQYDKKFGPV